MFFNKIINFFNNSSSQEDFKKNEEIKDWKEQFCSMILIQQQTEKETEIFIQPTIHKITIDPNVTDSIKNVFFDQYKTNSKNIMNKYLFGPSQRKLSELFFSSFNNKNESRGKNNELLLKDARENIKNKYLEI